MVTMEPNTKMCENKYSVTYCKHQRDDFTKLYWPSTYTSGYSLNSNCNGRTTIVGYVLTSAERERERDKDRDREREREG